VILPSKHLSEGRALITIGAQLLGLLPEPKTVSRLWVELKRRTTPEAPVTYDWFVLSLDLLYSLGLVDFARGRIARVEELVEHSKVMS
jgi:hypothetical protein